MLRECHEKLLDNKRRALQESIAKKNDDTVNHPPEQNKSKVTSKNKLYTELRSSHHSDAMLRFKRRKIVFSGYPIQLEIELHNEGIVLRHRSYRENLTSKRTTFPTFESDAVGKRDDLKKMNQSEFMPWGVSTRQILYSISVGRIPDCLESTFDPRSSFYNGSTFLDTMFGRDPSQQRLGSNVENIIDGLLIKALVTDYRVPNESAKIQRSIKFQENQSLKNVEGRLLLLKVHDELVAKRHDIKERCDALDKREKDCSKELKNIKRASAKASLRLLSAWDKVENKGTQVYDDTINKLQTALKKADDLNRVKSEEARALQNAMKTLKASCKDAIKKENATKKQLKELQNESKCGNRLMERNSSSTDSLSQRTSDVLRVVQAALEERRTSVNEYKENKNVKGLQYRATQRRLCLVLRPSRKRLIDEIYHSISFHKRFDETTNQGVRSSQVKVADMFRAEQKLLLAFHPENKCEGTPLKPAYSNVMDWTEPGVHLNLEVPTKYSTSSDILPTLPLFSVFDQGWCQAASAPGRQSSFCLKPHDIGIITSGLSENTALMSHPDVYKFDKGVGDKSCK